MGQVRVDWLRVVVAPRALVEPSISHPGLRINIVIVGAPRAAQRREMYVLAAPVSLKPDPLVNPCHAAVCAWRRLKSGILPDASLCGELVDPDEVHHAVAVDLLPFLVGNTLVKELTYVGPFEACSIERPFWCELDLPLGYEATGLVEVSDGLGVFMHAEVVDAPIAVQVSESQSLVIQSSTPAQVTLPVIYRPFRVVKRRGLVSLRVFIAPPFDPSRMPLNREDITEAVAVPIALHIPLVTSALLFNKMLTKWMLFLSRSMDMIFPCCPHSGGDSVFSNKVIWPSDFTHR